ncbi:hypothetical protein JG688_00015254 [Phytophthora aleatoria]|uniref:Uncharacterized protein n=1 Tax=Phytophthora aleatoria TaxID=2496075 RepID=A0A8J5I676_9STRA|nr:hypothetical protein JG688_00015254 [Phytophthora aleatoria]
MKPPPPKSSRIIRQGRLRRIQCSRATGEWSVAIVKAYPTDIFDGNDRTRPNDPQEGGGDGSSSDDPLSDRLCFGDKKTDLFILDICIGR